MSDDALSPLAAKSGSDGPMGSSRSVAKDGRVTVYFLDTSALVKRSVAEAGSDRVMSVVGEPGATIVIAD